MQKVFLLIGLLTAWCVAEQLVWMDTVVTFTGGRVCGVTKSTTPQNFVSPINYAAGTCYMRAEVLSKPTDLLTTIQVCIWTGGETCSWHTILGFKNTGDISYANQGPLTGWWCLSSHDWKVGSKDACLVLKDPTTNKWVDACGGGHCMGASATQHLPIKVKYTAIVTTANTPLVPPANWTCPTGWNCASSAVSSAPRRSGNADLRISMRQDRVHVSCPGKGVRSLQIFDVNGRVRAMANLDAMGTADARIGNSRGVYLVRATGGRASALLVR